MWEIATFGSDDDYENQVRDNSSRVQDILDDFGPKLVQMGRDVWDIQARALSKAPFITGGSSRPACCQTVNFKPSWLRSRSNVALGKKGGRGKSG